MADELKEVLVRLERLEQQLGGIVAKPKVSELTSDDVAAYHRVQVALWEDGTCGINETSPCVFKCNLVVRERVIPLPTKCDVECSCGPCNVFGRVRGGGFRFGGLGG